MLEIERKFLVKPNINFALIAEDSFQIRQAYLSAIPDSTVRVRISGEKAFLTVKSRNKGAVRNEWEYEIPFDEASQMMEIPGISKIEKIRYIVPFQGKKWEIDVFQGALSGLVLAEIELSSVDEVVEIPPFIDNEVTYDPKYYNSNLARNSV